jgi:hypothetical protein
MACKPSPTKLITQGLIMKISRITLLNLATLAVVQTAAAATPGTPTVQVNALFRVLKADGVTVVGQAVVASGGGPLAILNVNSSDALVAANGRCAFNVRYDEVANVPVKGTVNRLYSNDTLIAQNSGIDLQAGVLRSITTQPYLFAGVNNLRVVVNADAASPGVGWVRINVLGDCKAAAPKPPPGPAARPPVTPSSVLWNALFNAWGASNYATTQLKGKGYARFNEVVGVNAALTVVVNARTVDAAAYEALMARWNALANDPAFKAALAAVVPPARRI